MSLVPGTRFGTYEVDALIGAGGMGDVFRATDPNLKRHVALKVLSESFVSDANRLARLQREAEVLAALSHGNVAQIYGLERSDGTTALVMEHVEGETLAARIAQGALPPNEARSVALQIAAGLEAAHERGIVHRDLKPANIKITPNGTVKILDFGIAKALDARAISGPQQPSLTTPAMTEAGLVLGTAAYMSPEQARGKTVDKRADIWAFGCVLYEMLSGKSAFAGDDVTTTLARVLEREPDLRALPSGVPPAVRRTIELCLQKDAKQRLHDIGDVRLTLEGELGAPLAPAARAPLWRRALPVAAALVLGALLAGAYFLSNQRAVPTASPTAAVPITRFVVTPPASAPLADVGGYDVTISPDGKRLAYWSRNPENARLTLYVRELDGLDARPIPGTELQGAGNMNPFFSPDGKWIGYRHPQRGIVRVSVDGAPPIKMADDPEAFLGAAWTADDTIILSSGQQLQRVSAGGGGSATPLTPEGATQTLASPTLLPGERAVLFGLIGGGGTEQVAVLDLETGQQKILVDGGQNPVYVPTGHIVFARGTTLMAAPFNVAELALTGEPVAMLQGVRHPSSQTAADYALSATGTLVYVPGSESATPAGFAVVWVDRTGRNTERAVNESVEIARDPRLSPDGERLVLTTGPINDGGLWVYDLRGRPPIPLAVGGDNRGGVWSPDGTQIAFLKAGAQDSRAYITRADGSMRDPEPLRAEGLRGMPFVWSNAGEVLLTTPPGGSGPNILAARVGDASDVRDVVATTDTEFDPALSPNGRWLAYVSDRTGDNEIWVSGYPDGVPVRVSRNGGFEPRWSAEGRELFYLQGGSTMMAVAVETGDDFSFAAPVELFSGGYFSVPPPAMRTYDVARDGRFLMIQTRTTTGDAAELGNIVVVQNWIEELKQRVPARR